jgi:hypothetical protein
MCDGPHQRSWTVDVSNRKNKGVGFETKIDIANEEESSAEGPKIYTSSNPQ